MKMMKLAPAYKDYLWGGNTLQEKYHFSKDYSIIAEAWELSAHPDGPSQVVSGKWQGKTFIEYLKEVDKSVLGTKAQDYDKFPILIKFIDAKQALSIQVHPDDAYALEHEHEYGKNEMWYIMDCEPGSFLYYGVNQEITKEEFKKRIEDNTLLEVLKKVEVKPGDCFYIKAGTIHAIGEGIQICEIQQSSNSTYRVYDFGRVGVDGKPRELHIQKAIDVSNLSPIDTSGEKEQIVHDDKEYKEVILAHTNYFNTTLFDVHTGMKQEVNQDSFHSLVILEGSGSISLQGDVIEFTAGESIFVEANAGIYEICGNSKFILTTL